MWHRFWHKFWWGARVVGFWPAALGTLRLAALRAGRRSRAQVRLRSGSVIGFDVPSQVPPALVMFRTLIDPEFALLERIADPEWVVLDVGAAIGQFSVFAGRLPVAAVHAYEPSGSNIASLERNVAANDLADRVRIHQVALSDHDGQQRFTTQGNAYLSRLDVAAPASAQTETVPVRTLAGESARLGLERVGVLKVNVAGYEPEVLAGAVPLLSRGLVSVLVLLIGERSIPWYERCSAWGYHFFFYDPARGGLHELADLDLDTLEHPPWPARHVVAIHRDALDLPNLAAVRLHLRPPHGRESTRDARVVAR